MAVAAEIVVLSTVDRTLAVHPGVDGPQDLRGGEPLAPSPLPEAVQRGRRLFHDATLSSITTPGSGVSCASCHLDGGSDGVSWRVASGFRQTPSLWGPVADTAPMTWTLPVATLAEEAQSTSQVRMGGAGLDGSQLADLEAFLTLDRTPDTLPAGVAPASVERGREIFRRPEVGCAGCHPPPLYGATGPWPLFGLEAVDTPSLLGVGATAPYLHDGRFLDLAALLDSLDDGSMGSTAGLDDAERADLEAFLRSL